MKRTDDEMDGRTRAFQYIMTNL